MVAGTGSGFRLEQLDAQPAYQFQPWTHQSRLVHAIFTRHGGSSRPPYATLNLGHAVGDDPQTVAANHDRVFQALRIGADCVVECHLVHGNGIRVVTTQDRGQWLGRADGLVTGDAGVFLSMRFADCMPILLNDPRRGAVGVVHAGWRGTLKNVAGAAVQTMVNVLGCAARDLTAVIGPSIGPCCYQVGPDVIAAVETAFGNGDGLLRRSAGRATFDLWQANKQQLLAAGVGQVLNMELCTACHVHQFFSHRGEGGRTGRFGVVIGYRDSPSLGN
jgi:YfiH family protein